MELELLRSLEESISMLDRLRAQLEYDNDEIQHCIRGDVLLYYTRNNLKVMEILDKMKQQLLVLHQEHEVALILS